MRQALAHEALESGLNSPPQVGGGEIDVLTAYGVSIARRMEYSDTEAFVTWDRDLAHADPDPEEEIVIARDPSDADADPCDGIFFGRAGENGSPALGCDHDFRMSVFGVGAQEYRSVAALQRLSDWAEWKAAVEPELDHAIKVKKARTSSVLGHATAVNTRSSTS
jgi:hypothetical protein